MGIETWSLRDHMTSESLSDVPSKPLNEPPSSTAEVLADGLPPVSTWNLQEVGEKIASATVSCELASTQPGNADVLVIIERPALSADSRTLLASMMKAIRVNIDDQVIGTLVTRSAETSVEPSEENTSVVELIRLVNPAVVLLMATLANSCGIEHLDPLRSRHYPLTALNTTLAVTLHPQELLDNAEAKRPAWEDLKRVKTILDRGHDFA